MEERHRGTEAQRRKREERMIIHTLFS